eukprot:12927510-Prorocentrum_lima.AAC.1
MMLDIQPVSDRLQKLTLRGSVPLNIVGVYAPPAYHSNHEKEAFCQQTLGIFDSCRSKGPCILLGDWNVRLQTQRPDEAPYL